MAAARTPASWWSRARSPATPPCCSRGCSRSASRCAACSWSTTSTAILDELGWEWGGDWRHAADYHHIVRRAA
ncbi:MAG: M15 family metallopeptidase [Deltaproteobacteria bacterium]|nr:M15 family metallopeptidase [Deltaproteobacteria bacterium]